MPTTPELDAALVAAAEALPAHFADADGLTVESLDAIQATTMSLPGGAFAVESVVQGTDAVGSVVLIITGLVDHKNGEVFDRTEARTLWTAALEDSFTGMQASLGEFKTGQAHMTDPFDTLENADEAAVAGVFKDQTLAALLVAMPKESTGQGAAAELAAAIAQAEAESGEGQTGEDETPEGEEAAVDAEDTPSEGDEAPQADEAAPEFAPAPGVQQPAGQAAYAQDPYAQQGYPPAGYPPPGYPPYGYGYPPAAPQAQPQTAAEAAVAAAQAAAQAQANMNLPGMPTPPLTPFMPGGGYPVDPRRIDLLREVVMGVSVELGRTRLTVQEILGLTPGSVVELDRAAGAPVDVLVNGTLIAHGEVVVVDEEFAVRISEVVSPEPPAVGRASA